MRRALVLVTLLALAGCGGTADRTATPTVTPAPVPDDGGPASLPPGVGAAGVNATALAAAHRRAVANRSYTLVVVRRRQVETRELVVRFRGTRRTVSVAASGRYRAELATAAWRGPISVTTVRRTAYGDGERRYVRVLTADGARYRTEAAEPHRYARLGGSLVARLLAVRTVSVVSTPGDAVRVVGRDARAVNGSGYEVAATVAPDGFVRRLRATYRDERGSRRILNVTYVRVDRTSVRRPAWTANLTATPTPTG